MTVAERGTQDRIYESGGALLSCAPRQINCIVHDGRRRHAIEMQELIQAEANDQQDVYVEFRNGTVGETLDEMVEAALPPQRAGHDVCRQRAIAVVGEVSARLNEGGGKINAA
jgi:hypothetical protein